MWPQHRGARKSETGQQHIALGERVKSARVGVGACAAPKLLLFSPSKDRFALILSAVYATREICGRGIKAIAASLLHHHAVPVQLLLGKAMPRAEAAVRNPQPR